jgi:hypothetical protein
MRVGVWSKLGCCTGDQSGVMYQSAMSTGQGTAPWQTHICQLPSAHDGFLPSPTQLASFQPPIW